MSIGLLVITHNKTGQELVATAVEQTKKGIIRGQ